MDTTTRTKRDSTRPSDISSLIAAQHDASRSTLTRLSGVAGTLHAEAPETLACARALGAAVCDALSEDIAIERAVLVPALRDVDAWGADRADHLTGRLNTREDEIDDFRGSCLQLDGAALGAVIGRFIDHRLVAMGRAEIRDLSVLRDDVVSIDFHGG